MNLTAPSHCNNVLLTCRVRVPGLWPTSNAPEPLDLFSNHGPMSDVQVIREIMASSASSCSAYFTALQGSELLPNEQLVIFEFNHLAASSAIVRPMEIGAKF